MATLNKNFKVKHGLVVEGTTGTINGQDILTKAQADIDFILAEVGGSGVSENTPDTLVLRDETGSFAANVVTANTITIPGAGSISEDGELLIAAENGEDIRLSADDVRVDAVDDFRVNVGGDILLATSGVETGVYVGSIDTGNAVVTDSTLDSHIGDATVDGTAGNTVTDRIATAKSEAIDAASLDATTKADQAELDAVATANSYTDGEITTALATAQGYADTAETDAVATANSYTDGEVATALTTAQGYADTAESDANSYTDTALLDYTTTANLDSTIDGYGYLKSADLSGYATETYVNTAVSNLVDGAPELLNTLNELAAAIGDDENYATTVANLVAEKQNNLTAGSNIDITNDVISVTGLASTDISDFATASQAAGTGYFDAFGAAATAEDNANIYADGVALTAENNAKAYADGLAGNYDAYGSAATAETNANSYTDSAIGALDTDDIEEGTTNQYYTEERAKTDAAELLTGATLTNITITGNGSGLTITAENGVADSNTDDLVEGTTNKYFTDQRALDATASAYDVAGAAAAAQVAAEDYADGVALTAENNAKAYTDTRETAITTAYEAYADQAELDAKAYADTLVDGLSDTVDGLTTDDIAEGTNQYFTNARVFDAVSSQLVAGTNINLDVDGVTDTVTVSLVDDVVISSEGSLEVQSNNFNVGADSAQLRIDDGYVNPIAVFSMDADDDYAQVVIKNTGSGVNSSSDIQLYSNNGDDINGGWIDMGITSATFSDPGFTITGANDGYVFMEAPVGTTGDGNLVLATGSNGAVNAIVFAAGGLQSDNTQMTITPDESVRIVIDTPSTSPSTGALVVDGGVGIQGDVNIQGNITFGGEGTSLTTENLAVTDPLIYVGDQNTGDAVDMGIVTEYKDGATTKFAGLVRDASDGVFKVFSEATTKPTSTVNFSEAGLEYGDLKVDNIEAASANLTSVTIGMVDETEIAHLNGVTYNIQDQLDDKLELAGGTMSGAIAMGSNKVTDLADPTDAQDAATKAYVDAQTTTDVAEGTNLYFTDARAVEALEAVVPNFEEIDINSVATQVAAKTTGVTGLTTVYSFAKADYRSAKFLVKLAYGTHTEISEVLVTLDTADNIAMTEYAIVGTNGSLSTIGATIAGGNVDLTVDTANSSTVTVVGTLLA